MTTFHAVFYGILHGFTQFLPVSWDAHQAFVPFLFGWPAPDRILTGAFAFTGFLALFIYFRHDWASLISSTLQVIIYRRKPMTIDERLPLFILIACLPVGIGWYYLHGHIMELNWNPLVLALAFGAIGLPIGFGDSFSRKNKAMSDWNWTDAILVGIGQMLMIIPGAGLQAGSLMSALGRNYNREAAVKFSFFIAAPVLAAVSVYELRGLDFHAAAPTAQLSWLSFWVGSVASLFSSLLTIGGLMKNIQKRGFAQYVTYRLLLAAAVIATFWYRSRH